MSPRNVPQSKRWAHWLWVLIALLLLVLVRVTSENSSEAQHYSEHQVCRANLRLLWEQIRFEPIDENRWKPILPNDPQFTPCPGVGPENSTSGYAIASWIDPNRLDQMVLVADANEGAGNHRTKTNVIFGDGSIHQFDLSDFAEPGLQWLPIGEESPCEELRHLIPLVPDAEAQIQPQSPTYPSPLKGRGDTKNR